MPQTPKRPTPDIWTEPWREDWDLIHDHLTLPVMVQPLPNSVQDLVDQNNSSWNNVFSGEEANKILQIPIVISHEEDKLIWRPFRQGKCTTKEAYKFFTTQTVHPSSFSRPKVLTTSSQNLLKTIWKHKYILPRIKTFAWRLLLQALASAEKAGRYSTHINKECSLCGNTETDRHLFFDCDFARAFWFTADPPLRTHLLPQYQDSVQEAMAAILPPGFSPERIQKIFTSLWYLWKARNDLRFNNKKMVNS